MKTNTYPVRDELVLQALGQAFGLRALNRAQQLLVGGIPLVKLQLPACLSCWFWGRMEPLSQPPKFRGDSP